MIIGKDIKISEVGFGIWDLKWIFRIYFGSRIWDLGFMERKKVRSKGTRKKL
jgi:hypothetical protein